MLPETGMFIQLNFDEVINIPLFNVKGSGYS